MKTALLFTSTGPMIILTSYESLTNPQLLQKLDAKGIHKFVAHEVPVEQVRERYGGHFSVVMQDLHETDDLRVLDFNGDRVFRLFNLRELGPPIIHENVP